MNSYFIIIDKRDFDKITTIKNQKFWAFSQNDKKNFEMIKKNDLIYFGKQGFSSWQFAFKVTKKIKNSKLIKEKFGDDFRTMHKKLILQFKSENFLNSQEQPYIQKLSDYRPGIYKITQKIIPERENSLDEILRGVPERKFIQVSQPIRDTKKVRALKNYYQHKCQVCLERIEIGKNKYYSEVHHLRPLGGEKGEDDHKNMIVVCPTHHKSFDYCSIRISLDGKGVIDRNEKKLAKLYYQVTKL